MALKNPQGSQFISSVQQTLKTLKSKFPDFYDAVGVALKAGIVSGTNGEFKPGDNLTREALASVIYSLYESDLVKNKSNNYVDDGREIAEKCNKGGCEGVINKAYWKRNSTKHWYECSENDNHKFKEAKHTWDGQICTVCKEVFTKPIEATGHTEEVIAGTPADCTQSGLSEGKKCTVCGEITVPQTEVAALGHDLKADPSKSTPATCTEKGMDFLACSRCKYTEEKEVAGVKVLHHDYPTNGIGYLRLLFNVKDIPARFVKYLGVFKTLLGSGSMKLLFNLPFKISSSCSTFFIKVQSKTQTLSIKNL